MKRGFPSDTVVDVEEISDKNWRLLKNIDYQGFRDHYQVPIGQKTDFASVPRAFVWFLPRYGRYTKAAILHDYLWEVEVPKGLSRLDADGLFRQAMRELGVPFLRRWIMWAAVRWAALFKPDGLSEWWKEIPRVLLVTTLALFVIFPPFIPILLCLLFFHIMEWIVWIPLKIGHWLQVKRGKEAKPVNAPSLTWKL
jgi:Protein of unknown function (DUF1353)